MAKGLYQAGIKSVFNHERSWYNFNSTQSCVSIFLIPNLHKQGRILKIIYINFINRGLVMGPGFNVQLNQ